MHPKLVMKNLDKLGGDSQSAQQGGRCENNFSLIHPLCCQRKSGKPRGDRQARFEEFLYGNFESISEIPGSLKGILRSLNSFPPRAQDDG